MYINISCIYIYKNQCACSSMQGMCLCLVYHVCNTIPIVLVSMFFSVFCTGTCKTHCEKHKMDTKCCKTQGIWTLRKIHGERKCHGGCRNSKMIVAKTGKISGTATDDVTLFLCMGPQFLKCTKTMRTGSTTKCVSGKCTPNSHPSSSKFEVPQKRLLQKVSRNSFQTEVF